MWIIIIIIVRDDTNSAAHLGEHKVYYSREAAEARAAELNAAMKPQYANYRVMGLTSPEQPEQQPSITEEELRALVRVRKFVVEHESWEGENTHIATTGVYSSPDRYSLNSGDLKTVTNALGRIPIRDES